MVGCAVMEAITTAFPAMRTATAAVPPTTLLPSPAARPAAVPASSCCSAASQGPLQGSTLCGNAIACGASAPVLEAAVADCASPFPLSRHAEAAQAPAVQLSGACHAAEAQASAPGTPAAPLGLCAEPRACLQGSVFRQGFSRTPCSAAGCKGRAGAPGHLRALTPTLSGSGSTLLTRWLAGGCAGVRQKPDLGAQPGEDATAHVGKSQMDGACLAEGHGVGHVRVSQAAGAAVSQARTAPDSEQAGACPAGAAAVSQPAGCHAELGAAQPAAAPAPPGVCMSAPALLGRPAQSTGAAPACADVLGVSRAAVLGGQPGAGAAVNCPGAVRRAAPVLAPALARGAVAADEGRPRRAACGVRVMWVSAGARRQGIASRLMDAARRAFIVTSWSHHFGAGHCLSMSHFQDVVWCKGHFMQADRSGRPCLSFATSTVLTACSRAAQVSLHRGLCGAARRAGLHQPHRRRVRVCAGLQPDRRVPGVQVRRREAAERLRRRTVESMGSCMGGVCVSRRCV